MHARRGVRGKSRDCLYWLGFAVRTLWAALDVPSLEAAKQALAAREGISAANIRHSIGWWSPAGVSAHPGAPDITGWARERDIGGVVWTALKPKIADEYRVPTQEEVLSRLRALQGAERDVAEEYIRLAPRQIVTPYRTAIEDALGWTPSGLI
jgi:hypothetical protein